MERAYESMGQRQDDGNVERWGGFVRAGSQGGASAVRFAWIDEESGERLLIDVEGSEDFFLELEGLGFERQTFERQGPGNEEADEPVAPTEHWREGASAPERLARLRDARSARRGA